MNLKELFGGDGSLLFIAMCLATAIVLAAISCLSGLLYNLIRARNIRKNGWPPAHCDALGHAVEHDTLEIRER